MNKSPEVVFDCEAHSLSYFEERLQEADVRGIKSVTFLIAGKYPHTNDELNAFAKKMTVPVSGGVFPEVIYDGKYFLDGMIAILWFDETKVQTFLNASNLSSDLHQQQEPIFESDDHRTSFVFSNTKSRAAESALDALYYRSGQRMQYSGAGTGDHLANLNNPSIITNDGMVSDALQITCFPYKQKTHVGHGWTVISGPHLVTDSEENRVKTLDYQAIKPYYESIIRNSIGDDVKDMSFEQIMPITPVGIQPYDENMIVRHVMRATAEGLEFIGDIPVFSSIYILSGKQESLLDYVKNSADTFKSIASDKPDLSVIFSCAGRRLHMQEKGAEEIKILDESLGESRQVIGVSSIGEIASNNTGLACLHSMSLVVANLWI